jgi:predicted amidohydrolase YtcJ/beta-lactamase class A
MVLPPSLRSLAALALVVSTTLAPARGLTPGAPGTTSPAPKWAEIAADPAMERALEAARDAAVAAFADANLTADKIAMTVIDITDRARPRRASLRGGERIYPASVVKLFYMVAVEHALEAGRIKDSELLATAVRDMIVDSSNDATHTVVDALAGVSAGPELSAGELEAWGTKRDVVNALFASLGYANINIQQKTWCEGPYGREAQWYNAERRNKLTTDATARLLYEIVTDQLVTPERCRRMLNLMKRDHARRAGTFDEQAVLSTGPALPIGSEYFSKAGWMSEVRHDTAYVRLPNGTELVYAIFTTNGQHEPEPLSLLGRQIVAEMLRRGRPADTVFTNGRVWTNDPKQPWASALAVGGQTILALGDWKDVEPLVGTGTKRVDLQGRFVVPGFIDDHTHFLSGGRQLLGIDLRTAANPAEFAARLRDYAAKLPEGKWVLGGDWDHESWPGAPLPSRDLIDAATPRNPVFVSRLDGHMGVANSVALRLAGITAQTPDMPGGEIVRDPKTGEPTGVLKDAAMALVWKVVPEYAPAELDEALEAAMKEAARNGVTSIQDIGTWDDYAAYLRAREAGRMTVRVSLRTPLASWERQAEIVRERGPGDEWVKLGGLKGFMDGSLGSTTAFFFEPYVDTPETTGLLADEMASPAVFRDRVRGADAAGLQVSIHAIGDRANALLLDTYERVARDNGPRDRRFRVEHAQHLRPIEIGRFARNGVIASMQPYHAIDDGRWAEKRIGPARLKGTYAFRSLLDMGAPLAFGSDWTVAPINPLLGIDAAVTRRTLDGRNPSGWVPEQKISVEEALRAYTTGSAYAAFEERWKGQLAPGNLADFAVLSENLFAIDPKRIGEVRVLTTVVGGKTVFDRASAPEMHK